MALEKMDDLFGVTELVKQLDDGETGSNDAASDKNGTRTEQIEISQAK